MHLDLWQGRPRKRVAWSALTALCLTPLLLSAGPGEPVLGDDSRQADASETVRQQDQFCGPRALFHAAARIGVSVPLKNLLALPRARGSSMSMMDLKTEAERHGLEASGRKLSWKMLKEMDGVAVLFIGGNHFVAADSREKHPDRPDDLIRIYDDGPARWWTRSQLERVWDGAALQLHRSEPKRRPRGGSYAQFDELLKDFGEADMHRKVRVVFAVHNLGTSDLEIRQIKASCGCAHAYADRKTLPPAASGEVILELDLTGRRGAFTAKAAILTNETPNAAHVLFIQGRVVHRGPMAADKELKFDDVVRGETARRFTVLHDSGSGTLTVLECNAQISYHAGAVSDRPVPVVKTSFWNWDPNGAFESSGLGRASGGRPNDIVVQVSAELSSQSPHGLLQGQLRVRTNDPNSPELTIPISGYVRGQVIAKPPAILIVVGPDTKQAVGRHIAIENAGSIEIKEAEVEGIPATVSVENQPSPRLTVVCDPVRITEPMTTGRVICKLTNGECVVIPCYIARKD
jgi:hypothetical protein